MSRLRLEALRPDTHAVLRRLAPVPAIGGFYLAGGTAVALHLGHRQSEDLDFFCSTPLDPLALLAELRRSEDVRLREQSAGTLHAQLEGVKLSFLHYPYRLVDPPADAYGVAVAALRDLALIKLMTIAQRGSAKDFVDLFEILRHTRWMLGTLIADLKSKCETIGFSEHHVWKSLAYFADARQTTSELRGWRGRWRDVERFFEQRVIRDNPFRT